MLTQTGGAPLLLRNEQSAAHHWLRIRLVGRASNRDAIGAEVELKAGASTLRRIVMPTRSYLSQSEMTVTFGLGTEASVDSLAIHWPGGKKQDVSVDAVDQTLVIAQD